MPLEAMPSDTASCADVTGPSPHGLWTVAADAPSLPPSLPPPTPQPPSLHTARAPASAACPGGGALDVGPHRLANAAGVGAAGGNKAPGGRPLEDGVCEHGLVRDVGGTR